MADFLPRFNAADPFTMTASAALIGGQLLTVTGDRLVAPATGESATVLGVAGHDASIGDLVVVHRGCIARLAAAAAITAGTRVFAGDAGTVAPTGSTPAGIAITGATAGALATIALEN